MHGCRNLIALLGVFCFMVPSQAASAADAPPATLLPVKPRTATVAPAIAALQKEYQAYTKDPKANRIRIKSDYFIDHPSPDITPETILKALEASISGGPNTEAYVKWQLLSAVPGKFPDDLIKRAVTVYHRAPMPAEPHPGLDHRTLKKAIRNIKKEEIPQMQKEFDQAVEQFRDANEVIISYRDDLFSHLPVKLDVLYAGLEDVSERASHGLNANVIFGNVAAGIRSWAITEAKASQVQSIGQTVLNIKDALALPENMPYTKLAPDDKGIIKWLPHAAGVDPKKIDELIKFLENNASGPSAGGLKFKDPPKKTN
jgi:hypothetical protein